jgi:hypothetical protein
MLDRALKAIIILTLAVFAAQVLFGILRGVLGGLLFAVVRTGGALGHVLGALVVMVFAIGLLVRVIHWFRAIGQRQRGGRTHGQGEWGGRSFAGEVPTDPRPARRSRAPRRRR